MAPWPERPHKRFFSVAFPREHSRQALGRTLLRGVRFCAAAGTCSRTAPHISGRSQDGKALHLTGPPVLQRAARCAHGVAMDARLRPWQIWGSAGVNSPCAAAIIMAAARSRARSELWKTADEPSKMHAFYTSVTIRNFRRGNVGGNNTVSPARSICIKLHPDRWVCPGVTPESQSLCHPRSRKPWTSSLPADDAAPRCLYCCSCRR